MFHGRSVIKLALLTTVLALIYLGLQPFAFSPPNHVRTGPSGAGLEFTSPGLAISESALAWEAGPAEPEISIHLWLEPNDRSRHGFGAIFSLLDQSSIPALLIAQWRDGVNLRVRADNRRGYWEIGAPGSLQPDHRHLVTITSGPGKGTRIFVDGEPLAQSSRLIHVADGERLGGRLLFGSQGDGLAGWTGTLFGFAIQDTRLSVQAVTKLDREVRANGFASAADLPGLRAVYLFGPIVDDRIADARNHTDAGALRVPAAFAPPHHAAFLMPTSADIKQPWFAIDLILNLVGFIPFGFFSGLLLYPTEESRIQSTMWVVVGLGVALSAGIESIQILLPGRSSSMVDLIGNSLGTCVGAGLAVYVAPRLGVWQRSTTHHAGPG